MSRVLLRSLAVVVLAAAAVLIGWRVLAPAEVLSAASTPYPAPSVDAAQVTGRTNMAPLIVDGRIRVYAGQRQVRSDGPVDAKSVNTARWSVRRWPAEVSGVVASGTTVISRWSDGLLIAVDGRTGKEVWRSATGLPSAGYTGYRTGASVVWAPPDLWVGDDAVLVKGGHRLSAYEVGSGARRWDVDVPAGCEDGFTTSGGQFFCATGGYSISTGALYPRLPGPFTPLSCDIGSSRCAGLRDRDGLGYVTSTAVPRRSPGLDNPEMSLLGTGLVRLPAGVQLLGVARDRMVVLTASRHLQVWDPGRGGVRADFPLAVGTEKLTWKPGLWQVTEDWVAIERLTGDGPADPEAPEHYFTVDTVIIASLG